MAFFPTSPVDGEQANVGNILYQWSNSINAWNRVGSTVGSFLVDGATVSITGNIICSGSGNSQFSGGLDVTGNIGTANTLISNSIVTGNVQASNVAAMSLTATGNLQVGNISTNGNIAAGNVSITGQIAATGNVTAAFVNAASNVVAAGNVVAGTNFVGSGNLSVLGRVSSQTATVIGTVTAGGAISSSSTITAAGTVTGGNLVTSGTITAVGEILTAGNVVCGNILTDNYFYANGTPFSGGGGGGGGNASPRTTVTGQTATLAAGATGYVNVTGYLGYSLYKVAVNTPNAWVKIYTSEAARLADAGRSIGTDPLPSAGVVAEVIAATASTYSWAPALIGYNDEITPNAQIAMAVTNIGSTSTSIGVTLTLVKIEDPA